MATSGVSTHTRTRDEIIGDAMKRTGRWELLHTPSANEITWAAALLNTLLQALKMAPVESQEWTRERISLTLTDATASYTVGAGGDKDIPRPLQLLSAELRLSGADTPMLRLNEDEYDDLPSKAEAGTTDKVFWKPSFPLATLFVHPVIATASGYTLEMVIERLLYDFTDAADTPDMPVEWEEPLIWALTSKMAEDLGMPPARIAHFEQKAGGILQGLAQGAGS